MRHLHRVPSVAFLALVASFAQDGGAAPPRPRPGERIVAPLCRVADAGTFDSKGEFALGVFDTQRGWEAAYLRIPTAEGKRYALYSIPLGTALSPIQAPSEEPVRTLPSVGASLPAGLPPACICGHRDLQNWSNEFSPSGPLAGGVAYGAWTTPDGVKLLVHAIREPRPREYGPIEGPDGVKLERAVAIATLAGGDILVAGIGRGELSIALVEDVFADELMDVRTRVVREHFASRLSSALVARSWSVTALAAHFDRPYDALAVMGDGKVYCGTIFLDETRFLAIDGVKP